MEQKQSRRRLPILRALVAPICKFGCLLFVGWFLWKYREELFKAFTLKWPLLISLLFLIALSHVLRAYEFRFLLRRLNIREKYLDSYFLTATATILNYLPFNAGMLVRAHMLKRASSLSYTSYVALETVSAFVTIGLAGTLGLTSTILISNRQSGSSTLGLQLFFVVCFLGSFFVLFGPWTKLRLGSGFISRRVAVFIEGLTLIQYKGGGGAWLCVLAIAKLLTFALRLLICFRALGIPFLLIESVIYSSATILFQLFNLIPGNLGLREMAIGVLALQFDIPYPSGLAAAGIDRVVLLGYSSLSGFLGLWFVRKRKLSGRTHA